MVSPSFKVLKMILLFFLTDQKVIETLITDIN